MTLTKLNGGLGSDSPPNPLITRDPCNTVSVCDGTVLYCMLPCLGSTTYIIENPPKNGRKKAGKGGLNRRNQLSFSTVCHIVLYSVLLWHCWSSHRVCVTDPLQGHGLSSLIYDYYLVFCSFSSSLLSSFFLIVLFSFSSPSLLLGLTNNESLIRPCSSSSRGPPDDWPGSTSRQCGEALKVV